jgi:hypothetical protein
MTTKTYVAFTTYAATVQGSVTPGTGTYTVQFGYYCQIANMVFVSASLTWTAHTGVGAMQITIPIATNSSSMYNPEAIVNTQNIPLPGGTSRTVLGSAQAGTSVVDCYVTTSNAGNNPVALNATGTVYFTYAYSV